MMAEWELLIAVRDSIQAQIFGLALLAFVGYRLLISARRLFWRVLVLALGLVLFLSLLGFSLHRVLIWTPT